MSTFSVESDCIPPKEPIYPLYLRLVRSSQPQVCPAESIDPWYYQPGKLVRLISSSDDQGLENANPETELFILFIS